jgi:hypothetical protein
MATKEGVTTLPGSLGVNPPEWVTASSNVPPDWLNQEGRPCMIGGKSGTMQIKDGRLICVVTPQESNMNLATEDDVLTEATGLRFSSPSRTQISKAQVYWDCLRRNTPGLGAVKVSLIQGAQGNWFFDVFSNRENQFLDPAKLNNILPDGVTVSTVGPETSMQTASQNSNARDAVRQMLEHKLNGMVEHSHPLHAIADKHGYKYEHTSDPPGAKIRIHYYTKGEGHVLNLHDDHPEYWHTRSPTGRVNSGMGAAALEKHLSSPNSYGV